MASTYLTKTLSTPTNNKIFTISMWVKRSKTGTTHDLFSSGADGNNEFFIRLDNDDTFFMKQDSGGSEEMSRRTDRLFRDLNAWYHIVVAIDTTNATANDRTKVYINGVQETSFSGLGGVGVNFDLNDDVLANLAASHSIGRLNYASNHFDGLMAHFHFVDGTAHDADTFGETDSTSGIWKPKTSPSVTYGNNGFFLKFQDSSSLGDDSSGNTNDWTLNGSGTQTLDTPSNVFATYNPLNVQVATANEPIFGNGATSILGSSSGAIKWHSSSTLGVSSGKWYAEFKGGSASNQNGMVGVSYNPEEDARLDVYPGHQAHSYGYYVNGNKYNNNTAPSYGDAWTTDIIGVALDLDNHKLYFSKNGVWQNSGDPTSGATGTGAAYSLTTGKTYFFCTGDGDGTYINPFDANFGNGYFGTTAVSSAENDDAGYGKFEYSPPTGYYALCTKNINTYG
jgi:hypothetical protein